MLNQDQKDAVKKMQPLINSTSKQAFISITTTLGKQMNIPKHEICKNIERKLGSRAANEAYRNIK